MVLRANGDGTLWCNKVWAAAQVVISTRTTVPAGTCTSAVWGVVGALNVKAATVLLEFEPSIVGVNLDSSVVDPGLFDLPHEFLTVLAAGEIDLTPYLCLPGLLDHPLS